MRKALIFQGGWDGHQPKLVSKRFAGILEEAGFHVEISDRLEDCLGDVDQLMKPWRFQIAWKIALGT